MPIHFYLGRSGTGKTTKIQQQILTSSTSDPKGAPIIYLVPEQMTFQAEKNLVSSSGVGMIRTQVLSFSRLALRVLQEVGGAAKIHMDKIGVHMLIRKIVEQHKTEFRLFQKATTNQGFIDKMEQMLIELKRYEIDGSKLNEQLQLWRESEPSSSLERSLYDKLYDIQLVLDKVEKELSSTYLTAEDYLHILAEQIPQSRQLEKATIYIDGFHSFTPIELAVVKGLVSQCRNIHIALTLDKPVQKETILHPLDLFYETANTYQQLILACDEANITSIHHHLFQESQRFKAAGLKHLEEQGGRRPVTPSYSHEGIRVISAVNRRGEVEKVAREINSLVRDHGWRYKQIAILLRNPVDYIDHFETVFSDEKIPFFMDQKRSVLNHPLIEFIRSALEVIQKDWRYETVFRMLKTEFLFPLDSSVREKVDQLENYVLAYGIQGRKWYSGDVWRYRKMATTAEYELDKSDDEVIIEKELNELKNNLLSPVFSFQERLKKASTVEDYCRIIFNLLEDIKAADKLEQLRHIAVSEDHLRDAREHDQLWGTLLSILDQMVEMSGEEDVPFDLFIKMLETGFEAMEFTIIPPAFDQVMIANMETSRLNDIDCAFIVGANDGVIPAKPDEGSMISEEERENLEKTGMKLAPGAKRQLINENFLMYLAQAIPSSKLYITYPIADEEGRSMQPSMYLNYVMHTFPNLITEMAFNTPIDVEAEEELSFISHPDRTLTHLAFQLQQWRKGYNITPIWWDAYNWFVKSDQWHDKAARILSSLTYENKPTRLSKDLAVKLYGDSLKTSVSRLEQYNACPFSQFANYGLKLKERETFKLEAPDIGTLFHAALKEMAELLRREGKDFSTLSKDEAIIKAKTIVEQLAPKIQREILLSSSRFKYIQQKLEEVVATASTILAEHAKKTGFSPAGLEVGFGPGQQLPPLTFKLDNGGTVELIGRIDRVDQAKDESGVYVRIIDYKSSSKDIKLDEVYYGLALQMLIYLDVVVSFASEWLGTEVSPAGVLYFHVHNPIIQTDQKLSLEQIESKIIKEFKMKGLLSSQPEAIKQMDTSLESGRSDIVPVGFKKDGEVYSDSKVVTPDDYEHLRTYLRQHVKQIGEAILTGDLAISPYMKNGKIPCQFCSYKALCQFDASLETNDYRWLPSQSKETMIATIREKGGHRYGDIT
ncbi:helicase-exonuclease AddAB subunit AddB [Salipaludibacillus agaradhaerens]|uniref:ATP-dependent helicase/deoxyribonuclease subunit B n=1 Tax=Salipaludibacillus agaradhaerens TaxID=76935 RepID=A0A9Q4FZ08_SALAG|nr:helicase-exonuclease AddAB subunit AddB [Salipaludibacillus agaradhaerens]MCR6096303.1 helicase-exonuclease AddAB subunit AddB [Salipaludibacillus agaradhaerens]MCR6114138.1 helicase-exonuclease AddAB subunit AddB [Salipaludibacillus agaradhaerens]